jgi:OOP family OmpA-OmpF porin
MDIRRTLFCSLLVMGTAAQAEGVYILASGGQSHFNPDISRSDLDDTWTGSGLAILSSKFEKEDIAYKLQVGYQFNENFALEGGYIDLGKTEYKANLTDFVSVSGYDKVGFEAKGWNLDALLTLPINAGFSMFFKGGIFRAESKVYEKIYLTNGVTSFSDNASDTDKKVIAKYGLGVAYNFFRGLSARVEVERFNNLKVDPIEADVDLYSLGISYQF